LKVFRTWPTLVLDFWYPGPSYLVQEVIVLHFFLYLVSCTQKMRWRGYSSAYPVPTYAIILQFSSELSKNWGTGLPCLRPLWIYCTGQQHKALCIMNKQMHTWSTVLLYCSLFVAPTYFNANTSSSGSSPSVPAKLHKRVHAVLVVFY
jgi:hypothetical protein